MMATSLLLILMILASFTTILSTPLSLGASLLLAAILSSMVLAYLSSPLIAVMMFLIYIGGIMMTFAYFLAATPQSKMTHDIYLMKMAFFLSLAIFPVLISTAFPFNLMAHSPMNIKILLPFQTSQVMLIALLMLALLLAMMIIVKVTTLNSSPLRPFK